MESRQCDLCFDEDVPQSAACQSALMAQGVANPTNTGAVANSVANSQGGTVESVSAANSAAFAAADNAISTAVTEALASVRKTLNLNPS